MQPYSAILATGLVLAISPVVAADGPENDPARELEQFQGTWKTVSMVIDGRDVPPEEIEFRQVIITGNNYVVVDGNRTIQRGTFRLDPAASPKRIDTMPADGPNQGKVDRGIYELDGGSVRLCHAPPDKDRPTEFSAKKGTGRWLVLDQRVADR
jgi:uncharacterized protein (TIGR03067 family)